MKYVIIGTATAKFRVRKEVEVDNIEAAMEVAGDEKGQGEFWRREVIAFDFKVDGIFKKVDEFKFDSLFKKDKIVDSVNDEYGLMVEKKGEDHGQ